MESNENYKMSEFLLETFNFLQDYDKKDELKIITFDEKAPITSVEIELKLGFFFININCSLDVVITNIIKALEEISDKEIPKKTGKKIAEKIRKAYDKFQEAIKKMVYYGLNSIKVGYTSEDIPLLGAIFKFSVSFKAEKGK